MAVSNLLDITDFTVYPIRIIADEDFGSDNLDDIITTYQPVYLRNLLGESEYSKFEGDLIAGVPQSQHWIDFVDGVDYNATNDKGNTIVVRWLGVKEVLKYFMYFHYVREGTSYLTQTGVVKPSNENSSNYNIATFTTNAWNLGLSAWGRDWNYLFIDAYGYKQGINDLKYYSRNFKEETTIDITNERVKNTAYNFLYYYTQRNSAVFTDWDFYSRKALNINNI